MFYECIHHCVMLLFSGRNSELSAEAPLCTNYKPRQELMVQLTRNLCRLRKEQSREREGTNLHHLLQSRTVCRSAWAQEAESRDAVVTATPESLLLWSTGHLCVGYLLSLGMLGLVCMTVKSFSGGEVAVIVIGNHIKCTE